ncbi:MAG TPA: hypothetical protein VF807_01600, partial [Ktedonobacterales bacterium]
AQDFAQSYFDVFGEAAAAEGAKYPSALTILAADATRVLTEAGARQAAMEGGHGEIDPTKVRTALRTITPDKPLMGYGGAIAFSVTGLQVQRTLAVLRYSVNPNKGPTLAATLTRVDFVVGDRDRFCGKTSCKIS